MTYLLIKENEKIGYDVFDSSSLKIIKHFDSLDEANIYCWRNTDYLKRYQILANSWSGNQELTWYEKRGAIIFPNGYSMPEHARQAIIEDLKEVCEENDYAVHPNPGGDYSIIDTFTGEEINYNISDEEAAHPDPYFQGL